MDEKPQEKDGTSMVPHVYQNGQRLVLLRRQAEKSKDLFVEPHAEHTKRAYDADWRGFEGWATFNKVDPEQATPEIVALYFGFLRDEGLSVNTIERAYCGISRRLKVTNPKYWPSSGIRAEVIRLCLRNLRRQNTRAVDRKNPLTSDELRTLALQVYPSTLAGLRDRALLLIGFGAALRRSELVGLDRQHTELVDGNLRVFLPKRKTDQMGRGTWIGIMKQREAGTCPVVALSRWLKGARAAGYPITHGPLFRAVHDNVVSKNRISDRFVATIVKRAVTEIGLDPKRFSGHSLRSGFATTAAQKGVPVHEIMAQTGHESLKQLTEYIRPASVFVNNATKGILDDENGE